LRARIALALVLALLCTACAGSVSHAVKKHPAITKTQPNIVMIMTDDLDEVSTDLSQFPHIKELMSRGTTFGNFVVTDSWCCPSRASILLSQYVHSHGVLTNSFPDGGYDKFRGKGEQNSTIGTWMHDAGYDTAMIGKFLNAYPGKTDPTAVPPGWTTWIAGTGQGMYNQYNYRLIVNGVNERHGHLPHDYLDDVLTAKATNWLSTRPKSKPFFLYLTPLAPHLPATAPPRYANAFPNATVPRTAAFDQADVKGEPRYISRRSKLTPKQIHAQDVTYRQRLRSLLAVDDMIASVQKTLQQTGRAQNTYIVFTSDNGFHMGQHRLSAGKTTPYEDDIKVPMIITGPGIPAGRKIEDIASTVDLGPTFADLAGATVPTTVEGRSLVPLLRGGRPKDWRTSALVEFYSGHSTDQPAGPDCDSALGLSHIPGCPAPPSWAAIRTARYTYVQYVSGERQLFDRLTDPLELRNIVRTADPALVRDLTAKLEALRKCSGPTCRTADRAWTGA
jgi:N-acetylglucosamine-6-sulfatase